MASMSAITHGAINDDIYIAKEQATAVIRMADVSLHLSLGDCYRLAKVALAAAEKLTAVIEEGSGK